MLPRFLSLALIFWLTLPSVAAQTVPLQGYVFEADNRGYVRNALVNVLDARGDTVAVTRTDKTGVFKVDVPEKKELKIVVGKKLFFEKETLISTIDQKEKIFVKIEMERKPGYIFDVTIAEPRRGQTIDQNTLGIDSARIEVFNNTTLEEELVLENWPHPTFKFTFERGHHYTIMVRREGYFNKRIQAWVDVDGCILCFDGLGTVEPGVTDIMTDNNNSGTFLANIELEPLKLNATFKIENIYYDYDKWDIRPDAALELDNLTILLKDNPAVSVELGSHTDSRGSDQYNLVLSDKRAAAAVEYILSHSSLDPANITSKGYGESQLVNKCRDGVTCSEAAHQENRRTQLKVTGIKAKDPLAGKTLKDILTEERLLREVMNQKVIKVEKK